MIQKQFPTEGYKRSQIALLLVNCMLLFSTISLNGISVVAIRKSSQLRSKVCYYVILLQSIVDLGVGVVTVPIFIYVLLTPFLHSANCILLLVALRTSYLPCGLSVVTLTAMTVERYFGVLHPYSYQTKVTKKRILICVCGGSLASISAVAFSFYDPKIFRIMATVSAVVFLLFTGFVYTKIYLVIRKLTRTKGAPVCESEGHQNASNKQIIRESRYASHCFLIVVCFFLFLLPFTLTTVFFTVNSIDYIVYLQWSVTSVILNSSINSVMFFWTKPLLRNEALKNLKSLCS